MKYIHPLLAAALLLTAGCAHTGPMQPPAAAPPGTAGPPQIRWVPGATVIHVDLKNGHAILECMIIPGAGTEAEVYHRGTQCATLLMTGHRNGSYAAGNIVSGLPEKGDLVRFMRVVYPRITAPAE
ncbi:MAG: hypothetical protein AB7T27_06230 [Kiritimatiellia bacterium]